MGVLVLTLALLLQFLISSSSDLPLILRYDEDHPSDDFVPLKRSKRESTVSEAFPDIPQNWQIPEEYDKEFSDLIYYVMNITTGTSALNNHFVDLDELLKKPGNSSHPLLSKSYRRAVGTKLSFQFPFYGHKMNNLTIATGGFIYIGDQTHNWLAATQYIAPLMANFDTHLDGSQIIYADDGERFIVEWRKVQLREQFDEGPFTFQAILHKNGDIVFAYKDIPLNVMNISVINHPVKLGISDAYLYVTKGIVPSTSAPKRVIYEYHRIEVPASQVASNTVVYLTAQPTCIGLTTCDACTNASLKYFNCSWCHNSKKDGGSFCTDEAGMHRKRQNFIEGSCLEQSKNIYCAPESPEEDYQPDDVVNLGDNKYSRRSKVTKRSSGSGIALLVFLLGLSLSFVAWLSYAFYNPHTTSGQILIKYRPSRWSMPHSHVRYSASVHM